MPHSATTQLAQDNSALSAAPRATIWLAVGVLSIGAMVLFGWIFHLPLLTSILPGHGAMRPNTAVCLCLLAIATILKRRQNSTGPARHPKSRPAVLSLAGSFFAALALPVAGARIVEFCMARDFGIDHLILRASVPHFSNGGGRISPGSSVCIILIALTLLLLDWRPRLSMAFLLIGAGLSFSALIGFLFHVGPLFNAPLLPALSLPTAISLMLLQAAVLALRPEREPYLSLTHANRSGRRQWLLLGVTVVPALVALPLLFGMHSGLMEPPLALALLVVVLICIQTLILWQDSKALLQVEGRRRRAEQALLQSEKLAVVGRLAASISHEINNPLEAISNILYLIRNAESLESARQYALMAEQELSRVAQITTQTLSFYRENRQAAMHSPSSILESALTLLGGKINSSRVQVRVDIRENVYPIRCRDGELRQVLVNIISNAVEATPAGGQVIVRLRPWTIWTAAGLVRGVAIVIADSGRGIPLELRERIFEPFFTTKAHETGNGLGLWVVRDLIQKNEGSIRMRSSRRSVRQGTTFAVFFPYEQTLPVSPYGAVEAGTAAELPA